MAESAKRIETDRKIDSIEKTAKNMEKKIDYIEKKVDNIEQLQIQSSNNEANQLSQEDIEELDVEFPIDTTDLLVSNEFRLCSEPVYKRMLVS